MAHLRLVTESEADGLLKPEHDAAGKLTHLAAEVDQSDIDALREQGLSETDVSDAIQVIGCFNHATRVADGVGIEPEPELSSR